MTTVTETDVCRVATCDRPTRDGVTVCDRCIRLAEQVLAETDALVDELTTTIVRQRASRTDGDGGGSGEKPLPFHLKAADVLRDMRAVLGSWCRMLAEERPGWVLPADDPRRMATWLLARMATVQAHEAGGDLVEEVCALRASAVWVIDRPAERVLAGVCSVVVEGVECPEWLYASPGAVFVTCRTCGTCHDVEQRRSALLREAEGVYVTATEAAHALAAWSDEVADDAKSRDRLVNRIRMWADRGRIEARGRVVVGGKERALYRLGDILDLLGERKAA